MDYKKDSGEGGESTAASDVVETKPTLGLDAAPPFTPGPWRANNKPTERRRVFVPGDTVEIQNADGSMIACLYVVNWTEEIEAANARLIAAAPALYAALEDMLNPPLILEGDNACDVAGWFVEKARAALALANGQVSNTRGSASGTTDQDTVKE